MPGKITNKNSFTFASAIATVFLFLVIAYFIKRTDTVILLACWSLLFAGYFFIISKNWQVKQIQLLIVISIFFRCLFLFSVPNLSDDFYRFVWDGRLSVAGVNPFLSLPSEALKFQYAGLDIELYQKLNSPNYYSVYPAVMQGIFFIAEELSGGNLLASVIVLRCFILFSEIGTIILLQRLLKVWNMDGKKVLLYALNPLVIIELAGNLHFEAIMISFMLFTIYSLRQKRIIIAAISFALAICTKLLPLIFLPLLLRHLTFRKFLTFSLVCLIACVALFIPFINSNLIDHISKSVALYFQHFEFNASIYYLIREAGYWVKGYNIIAIAGKMLPIIFVAFVIPCVIFYKPKSFSRFFTAATLFLIVYYLLALIVHPWYLTVLVVLSVFTKFRFPLIWSALIGFTYITYHYFPYKENLWVVAIEYLITIGFAVYELSNSKNEKFQLV